MGEYATKKKVGPLAGQPFIERYAGNPVLKPEDLPYPAKLVCNAGVVRHQGRYVMVFRVDSGFDEKKKKAPEFNMGVAFSDDGIRWQVEPEKIYPDRDPDILGNIDPRLMLMEGRYYLSYCEYTAHGYRATIAATDDFKSFEVIDRTTPDNRDNILFPEKRNGLYYRLERPFPIDSRDNQRLFDIWISESPDLTYWGKAQPLLCVEDIPFANERLGAGPPPILTEAGWLVLFHAVDVDSDRGKNGWEDSWKSRYTVGAMLLDRENPRKRIAVARDPLMVPEAAFEVNGGFRNNVLFPTALVPEESGMVRIYYGAADTWVGMATARLSDIINFCLSYR